MFRLIKQVFLVLLTFVGSLATKCLSLSNEPCMDVTQIKNGTMINANASLKNIVRPKKIIVGILAHVFVEMASI